MRLVSGSRLSWRTESEGLAAKHHVERKTQLKPPITPGREEKKHIGRFPKGILPKGREPSHQLNWFEKRKLLAGH
jgi:hypothetical protein